MTIRETLSSKFYPREAIPNAIAIKVKDRWHIEVHTWGHPDIQRIAK
jgi:hypothetical protein